MTSKIVSKPAETPTPVAIADITPPFPTVTFYTIAPPDDKLWMSHNDNWTSLAPATDVQLTAGVSTTIHYWWDKGTSEIGYNWVTSNQQMSSTNVKIHVSITLPAIVPATSTQSAEISNLVQTVESTTGSISAVSSMTPSPSSLPRVRNSTGSLSIGAISGIAVGCFFVGIVVAGLIFWVCCGRRRSSYNRASEHTLLAAVPHEKSITSIAPPLDNNKATSSVLSVGLPQPLEDKAIASEIAKIGSSIKNHVQSYYHTGRSSPGLLDSHDLKALGGNMPTSAEALSTLLAGSATRDIALRLCIAWVIISRMQPTQGSSESFLPPGLAQCFQRVVAAGQDSQAHTSLLVQWRVITAKLIQSAHGQITATSSDDRNVSIRTAARDLENVLQPYADPRMNNEQRKRNLEEILKRAALFAFTLFSQPSSWAFDWKDGECVKTGEICIFPALVQVADENGVPIRPPRPFSEAVARHLDT